MDFNLIFRGDGESGCAEGALSWQDSRSPANHIPVSSPGPQTVLLPGYRRSSLSRRVFFYIYRTVANYGHVKFGLFRLFNFPQICELEGPIGKKPKPWRC